MVAGGMSVIKYLTFVFNFIFVICGIALITVGALAEARLKNYMELVESGYRPAPILIILIGCVIFLLAFLGCCGAVKENYCMLMTFSVLLFLIFIFEIGAGIAAYVYKDKIGKALENSMMKTMEKYNSTKLIREAWDALQHDMKCCGTSNYTDWHTKSEFEPDFAPSSCCKDDKSPCKPDYQKGCFDALKESLKKHIVAVAITAFVVAFIQVLGIIFGCCLSRAVKKEYETV